MGGTGVSLETVAGWIIHDRASTPEFRFAPYEEKRTILTLCDPQRAGHAFSPPISLGKEEGKAIPYPLLVILSFDMHFSTS